MRKNSIRKFVHAVLDLIPLFIIPIFAIYTRNENYNSNISVTTSGYEYQNKYSTNEISTLNDFVVGNTYKAELLQNPLANFKICDCTYVKTDIGSSDSDTLLYIQVSNNGSLRYYYTNSTGGTSSVNLMQFTYLIFTYDGDINSSLFTYFDVYELPEQDNLIIYTYVEGITYNDTDVGSQFVYTLYNATDKYFNMNNVFNMNDVYDWFVLNIFGGNAPLGLYIVWNIVLYEFVMDLLMLLYGVFMFFIDCCTKLIEKPLNAIK